MIPTDPVGRTDICFSPNSLLLGVLNSFLRCVRHLCRCWCPPFSAGHVAFLFICLRGVSLLVSALFSWRCNISIHSPNSLPLRRVSQFFLKMCPSFLSLLVSAHFRWPCSIDFFTFVSQFRCLRCWCPPFSAGHAAFLIHLFPMWFVYFGFPGSVPALLASALLPFPAFLFICLPGDLGF